MNRNTLAYQIVPWLAVAVLTGGWLSRAAAQEDKAVWKDQPASPKAGATAEPSTVKSKANVTESPSLVIYRLQYADPQTAIEVLQTVLAGGDRLIPDFKTHSLMLVSSAETQRKVADLLKKVDIPLPVAEEQQIKVFTLIHADPKSTAEAISTIGLKGLKVSIDERSRSIIAAGSMETLNIAQALMTKLDEPGTEAVMRYEVRVIWLASGLAGEGRGEPPADDLKDVVAELPRLGIRDPRQVGQMVVQTNVRGFHGGMFEVKSSPRFGDQVADFNASGSLSLRADALPGLVMQIRLRTRKGSSPQGQNLNEIVTQIALPEKQYVVLATSPTGNLTSVFVVQVTEVTKAREKKGNR